MRLWGPLLRLRDDRMERKFWESAAWGLMTMDQCATVLLIGNNLASCRYTRRAATSGVFGMEFFHYYLVFVAIVAACQAAVLYALRRCPAAYYRRRSLIVAAQRSLRMLCAALMSWWVSCSVLDSLMAHIASSATHDANHYDLLRFVSTRGMMFYGALFTLQFPLPFAVNFWMHTLGMLPVLLHSASKLVQALRHPYFAPAVCAVASRLNLLVALPPEDGACHRLSAHFVAFSATLFCGYAAPLYIAFVIEARQKLRFLRNHEAASSGGNEVAGMGRAAALDEGSLFGQSSAVGEAATCLLALANLLLLLNILVVSLITFLQPA